LTEQLVNDYGALCGTSVTLPVNRSYCEHFSLNQADLIWSIRLSVTIIEADQVNLFSHADFCIIFAKGAQWQRQERK